MPPHYPFPMIKCSRFKTHCGTFIGSHERVYYILRRRSTPLVLCKFCAWEEGINDQDPNDLKNANDILAHRTHRTIKVIEKYVFAPDPVDFRLPRAPESYERHDE